jgi:hypothetical protein
MSLAPLAALLPTLAAPAHAGKGPPTADLRPIAAAGGELVDVVEVVRDEKPCKVRCAVKRGTALVCVLKHAGKGGQRLAGTAIQAAGTNEDGILVLVTGKDGRSTVKAKVQLTNVPASGAPQTYVALDFEHEMGVAAQSAELEKK